MNVSLNAHELAAAVAVGTRRHEENIMSERIDTPWAKGTDKWRNHIEAACAEQVVAKALGVYWSPQPFKDRKNGDVGDYEVRWSSMPSLRVNPKRDNPDRPYVLVTGEAPNYVVHGWAYGRDVWQYGEEKAPDPSRPPAFFLGADRLESIDSLRAVRV